MTDSEGSTGGVFRLVQFANIELKHPCDNEIMVDVDIDFGSMDSADVNFSFEQPMNMLA
jgi:hypothetical protein